METTIAALAERSGHRLDQRGGDAAAARIGDDVDVGQASDPGPGRATQREADRPAVVLGQEPRSRVDELRDLAQLVGHVHVHVGRHDALPRELAPEALERGQVGPGRAADAHPTILAPASSMCAERLRYGSNRGPSSRTSASLSSRPLP